MDEAFLDCLYVYSSRPESTLTGSKHLNAVLAKVRDSRATLECLQALATISVWASSPSPKFSARLTDWLGEAWEIFLNLPANSRLSCLDPLLGWMPGDAGACFPT